MTIRFYNSPRHHADFIVYNGNVDLNGDQPNHSLWMIPGSTNKPEINATMMGHPFYAYPVNTHTPPASRSAPMEKETERLIRQNERLKAALRAVESYCCAAYLTYGVAAPSGGWRSDVLALVRNAWRTT